MAPECPPEESEQRAREVARRLLSTPYKPQAQYAMERKIAKLEPESYTGDGHGQAHDPMVPVDASGGS